MEKRDSSGAATAHGLTRDANGNFWFDINPGRRSLGKLETKTEKISIYETPPPMSPLGGAVTMDVDGKGQIWASAPDGVVIVRSGDREVHRLQVETCRSRTPKGTNSTYGAAGDRDGNGWWAQMAFDTIGKAEVATERSRKSPCRRSRMRSPAFRPAAKAFYDSVTDLSNGNPLPWSEGPRRMGTDKNADVLWVGNSWGSTLARIDTKTLQTTIIPFPDPSYQPYHIAVDQNHNVWANMWTTDRHRQIQPVKRRLDVFRPPIRGTEIRHVSLLERNGVTKVDGAALPR